MNEELATYHRSRTEAACAIVDAIVIHDAASYTAGESNLAAMLAHAKTIEVERKKATDPLNQALRQINGWFSPITDRLKKSTATLRAKLANHQTAIARANAEVAAAVAAAAQAGDFRQAASVATAIAPPVVGAMTTTAKVWDFRVTDPDAVPRAFLVVDERAIREYMRAAVKAGQTPAMPGVEFGQVVQVRAR